MICPKCGEELSQELETCHNFVASMTEQEQDTDNQPVVEEAPAEVESGVQPAEETEEAPAAEN